MPKVKNRSPRTVARVPEQARADRTRTEILDAAERLFGAHGFDGTKVRAIADAAGTNLGALHYYWGSKAALFRVACERRFRPMTEERCRRYEASVARGGGRADLRELLTAFLEPVIVGDDPATAEVFGQLYGRAFADPSPEVQQIVRDIFEDDSLRLAGLLRTACAHLPDAAFYWRLHAVIGTLHHAKLRGERLRHMSRGAFTGQDKRRGVAELVELLAAGLEAPAARPGGKRPQRRRKAT